MARTMKLLALTLVAAVGATATAQSISSFVYVDSITGVSSSLVGLNLTTTLSASPSFTWNSVTY